MMSNNKFHKILSDTITLPLLPASGFEDKETDTSYYAVLEKNYIPVKSDITCLYKPEWIADYKFEKDKNANEYNKLIITSIRGNTTKELRSGIMEFTVSNDVNNLMSINHIYAKVSLAPLEDIDVKLEFIPTENLKQLKPEGGVISGDELEIHIKYYAVLNGRNQSNVTLLLNEKSLDKDKIKSLKINSSDNTVELVYLIDENIDGEKTWEFKAIYKTQYNRKEKTGTITLKCNTYTITLSVDKREVDFKGGNITLAYKCTYTDGISEDQKEVKDNLYLDFSYIKDQNELKYNVIKPIYDNDSKEFKTTINVDKNYTFEIRTVKVKAIYDKKIGSNTVEIIQSNSNIKLLYLVEHLESNTVDLPTTNNVYYVSSFGETIRLHYYGIIDDNGKSVKITSVTNTKNNISTTYMINAFIDNIQYNNVTLNDDEYILNINFNRNESNNYVTKNIWLKFDNLFDSCTLTQKALSMKFEKNKDKSTNTIGGIPEYNNIILTFRVFDTEKNITVEDVNLYKINCDNNDVDLSNIQYKIITYKDKNNNDTIYIVASNIRCKTIYDKKVDRTLKFTVTYKNDSIEPITYDITLKSVIYDCKILPEANYVSGLGDDDFEITCIGITYNGLVFKNGKLDKDNDKHLESPISDLSKNNNFNPSDIITSVKNIKFSNKTKTIIGVAPLLKSKEQENTEKDKEFSISIQYHDATDTCTIKRLYLLLYIELYKDLAYSDMITDFSKLYISPFIDNKLYYKCYLCEIKEDNTYSKVDISSYELKEFSISTEHGSKVYINDVPTYNSEDDTYRGNIIIYKCITTNTETYTFTYILGYNANVTDENLRLEKTVNIYKPLIQTCTVDDMSFSNDTYIQYKTDETDKKLDTSYNDIKSILYIGSEKNGISSKGLELTLYYRVVYKIDFTGILKYNYIYGDDHRTYIDVDKTHFEKFFDENNITINSSAFENAEKTTLKDSSYLKIKFNVNKNDTLNGCTISKHIKYLFLDDTYNPENIFKSSTNDNNRIEIYQNVASSDISIFFDKDNSGTIDGKKITYNANKQLNQHLHVKFLLNDELQPTYSNNFNVSNNKQKENFKISDGVENKDLSTYKSEYNLNDLYIEPDNMEYSIYYMYLNGNEHRDSDTLTIVRTSFGLDNDCSLNATISNLNVSNDGDTVKITFWLTYKDKVVDLTSDAISKFNYNLNIDGNDITFNPDVTYDNETSKYSFDYIIDANSTVSKREYIFTIEFGKKSKDLTCTLNNSLYNLIATIDPTGPLTPLNPAKFTITCYIEKDKNGNVYQDVLIDNFSIELKTNKELTVTESSGELQLGNYSKKYQVKDNKDANDITYEFTCKYTLLSEQYSAAISITLDGAVFDVSIYDAETDESKQNIVNPVGETKTIKYFGILNGEHVTEDVTFVNETTGDGLNFMSEEGDVVTDTENKILSRKYKFKLNTTANPITYKFTVKYQDKSNSVTFKLNPGDIKLYIKADPRPIPRTGGNCTIYYYGYVGDDPTNKNAHILDNIILNQSTEVTDFMSYTVTTVSEPQITDFLYVYVFSVPPRETDKYIDRILKRNWSITYKNDNVEKTANIDIEQNGDNEFFPSFDIFGLKYTWTEGGQDLDTATQLSRSDNLLLPIDVSFVDSSSNTHNNTYDMTLMPLGFNLPQTYYNFTYNTEYKESNAVKKYMASKYMAFSGDNTQAYGNESIAVDFRNILLDYKLNTLNITLDFDIWMSWFQGWWDGKIDITFETYNNAEFVKDSNDDIQTILFKNYLYKIKNDIKPTNSITKSTYLIGKGSASKFKTEYGKIGRLRYNVKDKSAVLTINNNVYTGNTSYNDNESKNYKIRCIKIDNTGNKSILYSAIYSAYITNKMDKDTKIAPACENTIDIKYRQAMNAQIYNAPLNFKESYISSVTLYTSATDLTLIEIKNHNDTICDNIFVLSKYNVSLIKNSDNNIIKIPDINISNSNIPSTYFGIKEISFEYKFTYTYNDKQETFTLGYNINCNYLK